MKRTIEEKVVIIGKLLRKELSKQESAESISVQSKPQNLAVLN